MNFPIDYENSRPMRALRIAENEAHLREIQQKLENATDFETKRRLEKEKALLLERITQDR